LTKKSRTSSSSRLGLLSAFACVVSSGSILIKIYTALDSGRRKSKLNSRRTLKERMQTFFKQTGTPLDSPVKVNGGFVAVRSNPFTDATQVKQDLPLKGGNHYSMCTPVEVSCRGKTLYLIFT